MVAQYKERHLIKSESIGASFYVHIEVVVALKPQQFFGIIPDKQIDLLCAFTTMSFESVLIGKQVRLVIGTFLLTNYNIIFECLFAKGAWVIAEN